MPSSEIKLKVVQGAKHMDADCNPFLPLEVFDNTEYDSRTPEDWLALGKEKDGQKPVPGKALLANGIVKDGVRQYEWMDIGMTAYDKKTQLYQVNDTFFYIYNWPLWTIVTRFLLSSSVALRQG